MRHVSRTHSVPLDWLFDRINFGPRKKQIKYIDTKNQLENILTKGKFSHVMNEIISCVCLTLAISVPSIVLERFRKEHKKMQVKKELQAKIKAYDEFGLTIQREGIRTCLPRLHRTARGAPNLKSQNVPLRSLNVEQTRTGRPVMGASSNYSEWNIDDKWSSQEWKSGEMLRARKVRPVDDKFVIDDDMDSDTVTESNFSLRSRSLLNRVEWSIAKENWTVLQKMQCKDIDKCSMIWRNVYVFDSGSICIHAKKILRQFTFHQKDREKSHFSRRCSRYLKSWYLDNQMISMECIQ